MHVPKIHLWNRGTARRPNFWIYYQVDGKRVREPTGARNQREANAYREHVARLFATGRWVHPQQREGKGGKAFDSYARKVIARRIGRGVKTAQKDESGHVENHLIPMFGALQLDDLTFVVIRDAFKRLEDTGRAPRTIRNVHTTLRAILIEAAEDGLLVHVPPPLTARRGHLPPPVDKDPKFRDQAVFTREEIGTLLRGEHVDTQYRVMYAAYFLTGSRFSELLQLRRRDYDRARKPLASLVLPAAKTRRDKGVLYRVVPVHPELRPWLDWWLDEEYEVWHGRTPGPADLIFPTLSAARRKRGLETCSHGEIYKRWQRYHLPGAELRHRRLHDARRTFTSVARSSGASKDLVRSITHKVSGDKIIDAYTTWEWEALCRELAKVEWRLPAPPGRSGTVVDLASRRGR